MLTKSFLYAHGHILSKHFGIVYVGTLIESYRDSGLVAESLKQDAIVSWEYYHGFFTSLTILVNWFPDREGHAPEGVPFGSDLTDRP